jgi:hypothetical protein
MAKKSVIVIKNDVIMEIKISGAYYNRVYDLMVRLIDKQPDPKQTLINIDSVDKELSISEAVIQTYMMLIKEVEEVANKNLKKYTESVEIDIKDDVVSEDPS